MKTCSKCGFEKTFDKFYNRTASPDGKDYVCVDCRKARSRKQRRTYEVTARSSAEAQGLLAAHGIPSVSGLSAGLPYVDLAAWACVPIEAKGANETSRGSHRWAFSGHVLKDGLDGIFVFLAWLPDDVTRTFVVPTTAEWLFGDNGRPNTKALSVTIGSTHHLSQTWEFLQPYEDAFDLIELYRIKYSERLLHRSTEKDL